MAGCKLQLFSSLSEQEILNTIIKPAYVLAVKEGGVNGSIFLDTIAQQFQSSFSDTLYYATGQTQSTILINTLFNETDGAVVKLDKVLKALNISLINHKRAPIEVTKEDIKQAFLQKYNLQDLVKQEAEDKAILRSETPEYQTELEKIMLGVTPAIQKFKSKFAADVLGMTFVDFQKNKRILTNGALNVSIANFKNAQFKLLSEFVTTNGFPVPKIGSVISVDDVQYKAIKAVLKHAAKIFDTIGITTDTNALLNIYKQENSGQTNIFSAKTSISNKDIINAYHAYILLHEDIFDDLLKETAKNINVVNTHGKHVQIAYKASDGVTPKYSFVSKNNYYATWGDEDIDATKLMGNVASLIIENIPVLDPNTGLQDRNTYLTKERFYRTLCLLKDPQFISKIADPEKVSKLRIAHKQPLETYRYVIKAMLDNWSSYSKAFGVSEKEAHKTLYSFYTHILDDTNEHSLYNIDKNIAYDNPAIVNYLLTDSIIGAIDRTAQTSYTSYQYDRKEGKITSIEIIKKATDTEELNFKTGLDVSGACCFSNATRKQLIDQYHVSLVDNGIKFELEILGVNVPYLFTNDGNLLQLKNYNDDSGTSIDVKKANIKAVIKALKHDNYTNLDDLDYKACKLLKFVDELLKTNYASEAQSDLLSTYCDIAEDRAILDLIKLGISAARNHVAYLAYDKYKQVNKGNGILPISEFVLDPNLFIKTYGNYYVSNNEKVIDAKNERLRVVNTSEGQNITQNMAQARQEVSGRYFKANLRNAMDNAIPVNRMGCLATNAEFQLHEEIINNEKSALKSNIFATNPDCFKGCTAKTQINMSTGIKKEVADFTETEHLHCAIFYDFYGNARKPLKPDNNGIYHSIELPKTKAEFLKMKKSEQVIEYQPTTYSDKTTIYLFKGSPIFWIQPENGNGYAIDITTSDFDKLNDAIKDTIGQQYKKIYSKVLEDYRYNVTDDILEKALSPQTQEIAGHTISETLKADITKLKNTVESLKSAGKSSIMRLLNNNEILLVMGRIKALDYRVMASKTDEIYNLVESSIFKNDDNQLELKLNDLTEEQQNIVLHHLRFVFTDDVIKYLMPGSKFTNKDLTNEHIKKLVNALPLETYNKILSIDHSSVIEELHYLKSNPYVEPNKLLKAYATQMFDDTKCKKGTPYYSEGRTYYEARMIQEKAKFLANLVKYNFTMDTLRDGHPNSEVYDALIVAGYHTKEEQNQFFELWKDMSTGLLYLAKDANGHPIDFLNIPTFDFTTEESNIYAAGITLNPLLERYFLADYLLSENTRLFLTGASFVHKNGFKKYSDPLLDVIKEAASREGAQYKRQVIIPGTMQFFLLKSILGVSPTTNVAVIKDAKAFMYNINGLSADEDAHDGSAIDHPIWGILENYGLQDCEVGEDKKLLSHDLTAYGIANLQKYAVFSSYNERMRKSKLSNCSFYNLVYNMSTTLPFKGTISYSKNLFGKEMHLKDVTPVGKDLYFRKGNKHYKIIELADKDADTHIYTITKVEVNSHGEQVGEPFSEDIKIDCMWDLMESLGGVSSEELAGDKLRYCDNNLKTIANYVNNVGTYHGNIDKTTKIPTELPTQDNCTQPLKTAFVHCCTNASGFKNGVDKINGKEAWKPGTKLMYLTQATYNTGPQMDADHIVVNGDHQSEMTEPSQIISALEANGYTHEISKEAYYDLGKVALAAIAPFDEATKEFINSGYNTQSKHKLYHQVGQLIIKAVLEGKEDFSTSGAVLELINKNFNKSANHSEDEFKIPFSNPNIFAKSLAEFTSKLNKTAIKRKFAGEGAVMVPAYDIMTYFQIGDNKLTYDDVLNEAYKDPDIVALYPENENAAVTEYLKKKQNEVIEQDIDKLLPGQKAIVRFNDGTYEFFDFDDYDKYMEIKHDSSGRTATNFKLALFVDVNNPQLSYTDPLELNNGKPITTNLKPQETYWTVGGKQFNLYDIPQIMHVVNTRRYLDKKETLQKEQDKLSKQAKILSTNGYDADSEALQPRINAIKALIKNIDDNILKDYIANTKTLEDAKRYNLEMQDQVNKVLECLHRGLMPVATDENSSIDAKSGFRVVSIDTDSLHTNSAEMMMSRIYAEALHLSDTDSLHDIISNPNYFRDKINTHPEANGYDVCYLTSNGNHLYISTSVKENLSINEEVYNNPVGNFITEGNARYRIDSHGNKLYLTGEYRMVKNEEGKRVRQLKEFIKIYKDENGHEVLVIDKPETAALLYKTSQYYGVIFNSENDTYIKEMYKVWDKHKKLAAFRSKVTNNFSKASKEYINTSVDKLANAQYTSFLTSLDYTVGRIPAQALQSFMKMKCVAFLDTKKNVVHVSHYQTWLQGSDYDIDKAYIMGNDYDSNGLFTKWSPLFDFSSYEALNKSMELPTPNGKSYKYSAESQNDITPYLTPFISGTETLNDKIALLKHVDNLPDITYNELLVTKQVADRVLQMINEHNQYFVNNSKAMLGGFKNSVSSKVRRVVSDVRNAAASYTPIGMDDPREAASNSSAGKAVETMTGVDPSTKFIMTVQNMSGKKVIGIAATGEKIFFALSYYYNELVSRNDDTWFKNAFFLKVLYKIQQQTGMKSKPELIELFRHAIANVNFYNNSEMKLKWENAIRECFSSNKDMTPDLINAIISEQMGVQPDQSLVISALLSAATDNAKELILDKINAGPDLAGLYLHQIIMGVDFQDIAAMMTSPTMYAIKELCLTNAFSTTNQYPLGRPFDTALNLVQQGPGRDFYISRSLNGTPEQVEQFKRFLFIVGCHNIIATAESLESDEIGKLLEDLKKMIDAVTVKNYYSQIRGKNFQKIVWGLNNKAHMNLAAVDSYLSSSKLYKEIKKSLKFDEKHPELLIDPFTDANGKQLLPVASRYTGAAKYIREILRCAKIASNVDYSLLDKIEEIKSQAAVTTTLGLAILSANQGFATDLPGKLSRLNKLENIMLDAEDKKFKKFTPKDLDLLRNPNAPQGRDKVLKSFVSLAKKSDPMLTEEDIMKALNDAIRLEIFDGGFKIEKFLNDPEYRKASIAYYNCIKETFNLYDIMDKVPHFKAIFDVFNIINTTDNEFSRKFKYMRSIVKRLYENGRHGRSFNENELKGINSFLDEYFAIKWLNNKHITFKLPKGEEYFDIDFKRTPIESDTVEIDLATDQGRASFKLYMEQTFIPELQKGRLKDGIFSKPILELFTTRLLREMQMTEQLDRTSGVKIPYYKVPIDMRHHDSTADAIAFTEYSNDIANLTYTVSSPTVDGGVSVADMLFLYNLIANKDKFGSDRLTALFGTHLKNPKSLAYDYYNWQGEEDFTCIDESDEIDLDDVLLSIAPICGEKLLDLQRAHYVFLSPKNGLGRTKLYVRTTTGSANTLIDDEFGDIDEDIAASLEEFDDDEVSSSSIELHNYKPVTSYNAHTDDYFKYATLRHHFESELIAKLQVTDQDLVFDDAAASNLNNKIISLIGRNALIAKLIC